MRDVNSSTGSHSCAVTAIFEHWLHARQWWQTLCVHNPENPYKTLRDWYCALFTDENVENQIGRSKLDCDSD